VGAAARRDGFRSVYDAHVGEVHRFVHRRSRDLDLAADITQDVFLAAVRTFDDPSDVTIAWLMRVARNRLIDLLRRDDTLRRKLRLVSSRDGVDHGPDVVERVRVERAFGRLSPAHRVALTLHHVDGLTVAELADELGRSPKGAEALLTRARAALRAELDGEIGVARG
jgi:RNA polymerase sigma-70 factor (ECF subfamily)